MCTFPTGIGVMGNTNSLINEPIFDVYINIASIMNSLMENLLNVSSKKDIRIILKKAISLWKKDFKKLEGKH